MKIITIRDFIESLSVFMSDPESFQNDAGVWCFSRDRVLEVLNDIAYDVDLNPEEGLEPLGEEVDHGRWSENHEQEHRPGGPLAPEVAPGHDDGERRGRSPYTAFGRGGARGTGSPNERARAQLEQAFKARVKARAQRRGARRRWAPRSRR